MRAPAVAGTFYPARLEALRALVDEQLAGARPPPLHGIRALIVPHAGLRYSGAIAAHAYRALASDRKPAAILIVGPDHRAIARIGASDEDWRTPLGVVPHDRELVAKLGIAVDERPHAREHSIEVQLPLIQALWPEPPPIACVAMGDQSIGAALAVAERIRGATAGHDIVLVASCDMAHEGPAYRGLDGYPSRPADGKARAAADRILAAIEALDPARVVAEGEAGSSCGHGPVAAVIAAAGASRAVRLAFGTSNDIEPNDSSVAYAALALV